MADFLGAFGLLRPVALIAMTSYSRLNVRFFKTQWDIIQGPMISYGLQKLPKYLLMVASEAARDSGEIAVTAQSDGTASNASTRALTPASAAAMNTLSNVANTELPLATKEDTDDGKAGEHNQPDANDGITIPPAIENSHPTAMPRPSNVGRLNTSFLLSGSPRDRSPVARNGPLSVSPSVRNISAGFNSISLNPNFSIEDGTTSPDHTWNSAVGKANLGKSGRVIEKLMAENDMLKRDLQIARLAVEESKQDVKMMEGKMEALSSEYEAQIHDAQVTKAMLKKRDRQVTELKAAIDSERDRANNAVESESNWRSALEKTEVETRAQVDQAMSRAMLMEARYNTLSGHWKEEGAVFEAKIERARAEIESLHRDRVSDTKKLHRLDELLEQRDHALNRLTTQKETMEEVFEQYKRQQENALSGMKQRAQQQDSTITNQLEEVQSILGQLRWVFAVQTSLRPESEEQVEA
jgi:hypothetical protein